MRPTCSLADSSLSCRSGSYRDVISFSSEIRRSRSPISMAIGAMPAIGVMGSIGGMGGMGAMGAAAGRGDGAGVCSQASRAGGAAGGRGAGAGGAVCAKARSAVASRQQIGVSVREQFMFLFLLECLAGRLPVRNFLVADVGAQHADLEENAFGLQPLAQFLQLARRHIGRRVGNIHQHALEFVEYAGDPGIAG